MKILCIGGNCAPFFIRSGWGRVFAEAGHTFSMWDNNKKSAFDAFAESDPDIFLGTTYELDRATFKNIASRPNLKVGLFASAFSEFTSKLDRQQYPIVVAQENEIKNIEKLKKETGKPDFVFIHITDRWKKDIIGGWESVGVKTIGILNAADIFQYINAQYDKRVEADVSLVSGYWGYKAQNLDKWIMPLCNYPYRFKTKIYGNSSWPCVNYLGGISVETEANIYRTSLVSPNISEPHSYLFPDITERVFKVMIAKGFCIQDNVKDIRDVFSEKELAVAKNPIDFFDKIEYYIKNTDERAELVNNGFMKVLKEHTYHNRVAQMLGEWGLEEEKNKVLVNHGKWITKYGS